MWFVAVPCLVQRHRAARAASYSASRGSSVSRVKATSRARGARLYKLDVLICHFAARVLRFGVFSFLALWRCVLLRFDFAILTPPAFCLAFSSAVCSASLAVS